MVKQWNNYSAIQDNEQIQEHEWTQKNCAMWRKSDYRVYDSILKRRNFSDGKQINGCQRLRSGGRVLTVKGLKGTSGADEMLPHNCGCGYTMYMYNSHNSMNCTPKTGDSLFNVNHTLIKLTQKKKTDHHKHQWVLPCTLLLTHTLITLQLVQIKYSSPPNMKFCKPPSHVY